MFLLLACTTEPADTGATTSTTDTDPGCAWEETTTTPIDWETPTASGGSAAELFGFAVGSFDAAFTWDDTTTTTLRLATAVTGTTQTTYGESETCPISLSADVDWTLDTDDVRVGITSTTTYGAEESRPDQDLGSVTLAMPLAPEDVAIAPLDATSSMNLRLVLRSSGQLDVAITEWWSLDTVTARVCTRGSTDEGAIGCIDYEETGETT